MTDIATLKAQVDFRALVQETHLINASSKVLCPFHDDHVPSCHIYRDGFKCYGCGTCGDHLDWLERTHDLNTAQAVRALEARSRLPSRVRRSRRRAPTPRNTYTPLTEQELQAYRRRLCQTRRLPGVLAGRGLTLADARALGIAAVGEDALLAITGPEGEVLALKRRFFQPGGPRYCYMTAGHGSPAWCSPEFAGTATVLVIEGELNGMISWLALREAGVGVAVMAAAGTQAGLHERALKGKEVFIYADADAAGAKARSRWRARARRAGARTVTVLSPFEADACALAGGCGRLYLAERLLTAMRPLQPWLLPPASQGVAWTRR